MNDMAIVRPEGLAIDVGDVLRAHTALTLDQRQHRSLVRAALAPWGALLLVFVAFLATDIGFVDFYDFVRTAEFAR